MAVYTPPTEILPIFDNSVFPASDSTVLTISNGRNYFLTYPVAQGEEIFSDGLTLSIDKYITSTPSASVITGPTAPTQIGCIVNGDLITTTMPTSGNITSLASVTITQGTWIIHVYRSYNNSNNSTRIIFSFGLTQRTNVTPISSDYEYGITTVYLSNQLNYAYLSTTITATGVGNTLVYLNINPTYTSAPASATTNFRFTATRIA